MLTHQAAVDPPTVGILSASHLFAWRFKNWEPVLALPAAGVCLPMKGF